MKAIIYIILAILMLLPSYLMGVIWTVSLDPAHNPDFGAIQDAFDHQGLAAGDTILVYDGVYAENLTYNRGFSVFLTSNYTITGEESHIFDTIITGLLHIYQSGNTEYPIEIAGISFIFDEQVNIFYEGIWANDSYISVHKCRIIGFNYQGSSGTGISMDESIGTITESLIKGNYQGIRTAANWRFPVYLFRTEISDNEIGVFIDSPTMVQIDNTTIACNNTGIYAMGELELRNSIVRLNNTGINEVGTPDITVTYSNIEGGWPGTGNIDADPLFYDPAGRNFRLEWTSPCIDAGDPDFNGNGITWPECPYSSDPDGTRMDIGAYPATQDLKIFVSDLVPTAYSWESFPRLLRDEHGNQFAPDVLAPIEGNVVYVLDEERNTMEWIDGQWWFNGLDSFRSDLGYKLRVENLPQYLPIQGDRIELDYPVQIFAGRENWRGYFIPATQWIFESIIDFQGDSPISSIQAERWSIHRSEQGWIKDGYEHCMVEYGKMYVFITDEDLTFNWNIPEGVDIDTIGDDIEPRRKPDPEFFVFEQGPDYESYFIMSIENDDDVLEVGIYADDECIGASKVLAYPVEIQAYVTPEHLESEISFAVVREGNRSLEMIPVASVRNEATGEYSPRLLRPGRQKFTVVRLDNADELPEGIATRPEIVLSQNHPNPFLPASSSRSAGTSISYHVSQNAAVNLTVYNIRGQRVKRLFEGEATAGRHTVYWDGRDEQGKLVGSGIYFYKLSSEHETQTKKMLLVR